MTFSSSSPIPPTDKSTAPAAAIAASGIIELSPRLLHPSATEPGLSWKHSLLFHPPSLKDCAVTLNRILRFEQPVTRNQAVYERFLQQNQHPPKWSKKEMADLPGPVLEKLSWALFDAVFPSQYIQENALLALYLFVEEQRQYHLEHWGQQELFWLGQHNPSGLHSYYFNTPLAPNTLLTLLEMNHYRTDLATAPNLSLWEAYFSAKVLTHPWPWVDILTALDFEHHSEHITLYPFLHRLWQVYLLLKQQDLCDKDHIITPETLSPLLASFHAFCSGESLKALRGQLQLPRPVELLILVEGTTEERLFPVFSRALGLDLNRMGVLVTPAGGKNQVFVLYQKYATTLAIPIFVLLDQDAKSQLEEFSSALRPQDKTYLLPEGEIEDAYELSLLVQTINAHYAPHPKLTQASLLAYQKTFQENQSPAVRTLPLKRVQLLKAFWKDHQLGEFDKSLFATHVGQHITAQKHIPPIIQQLLMEVKSHVKAHDKP